MADEREWVTITHPDAQGETAVVRRAFDEVWKDKGWKLADSKSGARKSTEKGETKQ